VKREKILRWLNVETLLFDLWAIIFMNAWAFWFILPIPITYLITDFFSKRDDKKRKSNEEKKYIKDVTDSFYQNLNDFKNYQKQTEQIITEHKTTLSDEKK
jgi:hypothetical protein